MTSDGFAVLITPGTPNQASTVPVSGGSPVQIASLASNANALVSHRTVFAYGNVASSGYTHADLTVWTSAAGAHTYPRTVDDDPYSTVASADGMYVAFPATTATNGIMDYVLTSADLSGEVPLFTGSCLASLRFSGQKLVARECGLTLAAYAGTPRTRHELESGVNYYDAVAVDEQGGAVVGIGMSGATLTNMNDWTSKTITPNSTSKYPFLKADGSSAVLSIAGKLNRFDAAGSAPVELVPTSVGRILATTRNFQYLAYSENSYAGLNDLYLARIDQPSAAEVLVANPLSATLGPYFTRDDAFVVWVEDPDTSVPGGDVRYRPTASGAVELLGSGIGWLQAGRWGWVVYADNLVYATGQPTLADLKAKDLLAGGDPYLIASGVELSKLFIQEDGSHVVYKIPTGASAGVYSVEMP